MEPTTTQAQIQELESVRKSINLWRASAVAIVFGTVVVCGALLYSDVNRLKNPGPGQERFVTELQEGLNKQVVPRLQDEVSRTLTEMQPVVQTEFVKLNERVPDITQASLKQMDELQKSLPTRAEKVLDETFTTALRAQEPEIRKMFPDATEAQVNSLFEGLSAIAAERGEGLANELLTPQLAAMNRIHLNLKKIQLGDKTAPAAKGDDWELGLAVFDVVRDDVKDLTLPSSKVAKMVANAAGQVADTANTIKDKANKMAKEEAGR